MTDRSTDRSAALLTVEGLECRRGERTLFGGLGFRLEPGAIVWIRGANGQGKTTLLRTLAGLSRPEAGRVAWREPQPVGRALYLAHANALKEELSAAESLRFLRELDGGTIDAAALAAALERFGMASRSRAPVRTLQRELQPWLLDEPFDALDAGGVEILNAVLVEHARRGGGVVLTSHLPLTIAEPRPTTISLDAAAIA